MDERLDATSVFYFAMNYNLIRFINQTKTNIMMFIGRGEEFFA